MFWTLLALGVAAWVYFLGIKPLVFWKNRGIPQPSLSTLYKANLKILLQLKPQAEFLSEMFNDFPNARYIGMYQLLTPVLALRDPDLIKQITVKDFDHFVDHNQFIPEEVEPLWGKNLFALKGDRWRDMRATLSPSFTSSKMKNMFGLMAECAEQFVRYFRKEADSKIVTVELKDVFTRFSNDVIATCAFGVTSDSLKDRNNEFFSMGKEATSFRGFWTYVKFMLWFASPKLAKLLGVRIFSTQVSSFFSRLVRENVEFRERTGLVRPDMIHLLMEARKGRLRHEDQNGVADSGFAVIEESDVGKEEKRQKLQLTDDDMTAQALIFFFAGFESVSTLMSFLAYELGVNTEAQEGLREEVDEALKECGGQVTYEALLKMKYLDMVVSETLRKWPAGVVVDRVCIKPYTIEPTRNCEKPVQLKQGDILWLPIYGIHRCPEFYPDPDHFDPERFNDENKNNIYPYSYVPFGAGPRSCIGNRFALLETKTIIFYILANFEITPTDKTTVPLRLSRGSFNLASENGFWFGLKPRKVTA